MSLSIPERYQAENFVDTFDLGDNTKIDLRTNGTVHLSGIGFTKGAAAVQNVSYNGFYYSAGLEAPFLAASAKSTSSTDVTNLRILGYAYDPKTNTNLDLATGAGIRIGAPGVAAGDGDKGSFAEYKALDISNVQADRLADNGVVYSIYTNQNNNNADGKISYNFYADGGAPNYFKGLTEHEGGVKLTGGGQNGVANGLRSTTGTDNVRIVSNESDVFIAAVDVVNENVSNTHFALGSLPSENLAINNQYGIRLLGTSETGPGSQTDYIGVQSRTQGSPSGKLFKLLIFQYLEMTDSLHTQLISLVAL